MSNIPQPYQPAWYEKNGIQFDLEWNVLPAGLTLDRWLFDYDGAYARYYQGYNVFWLRGWVRILGIRVGAGIFHRGSKVDGL